MLRDEDGMAAIRRLLAVVAREGRRKARCDEFARVTLQLLRTVELCEAAVAASQVEAVAELSLPQ